MYVLLIVYVIVTNQSLASLQSEIMTQSLASGSTGVATAFLDTSLIIYKHQSILCIRQLHLNTATAAIIIWKLASFDLVCVIIAYSSVVYS